MGKQRFALIIRVLRTSDSAKIDQPGPPSRGASVVGIRRLLWGICEAKRFPSDRDPACWRVHDLRVGGFLGLSWPGPRKLSGAGAGDG